MELFGVRPWIISEHPPSVSSSWCFSRSIQANPNWAYFVSGESSTLPTEQQKKIGYFPLNPGWLMTGSWFIINPLLFQSPHNWVVFHPQQIPQSQPFGPLVFSLLNQVPGSIRSGTGPTLPPLRSLAIGCLATWRSTWNKWLTFQRAWYHVSSWWLNQPLWKIWVKLEIFPK